MTDEELIARLRKFGDLWPDDHAAADRIKALVKERDEALEWLSASQGYIADAVFALDKQEKAEAERDALRAERDRYLRHLTAGAESLNAYKARAEAAEAQIATLTARVERLTGALEWYAKDGWNDRPLEPPTPEEVEVFGDNILDFPMPEIFFDRGERARAALSATTEEGK